MLRITNNGITLHKFNYLSPYRDIEHFVSGRDGGVSNLPYSSLNLGFHVGDDPKAVLENRHRLAAVLQVPLEYYVFCKQVHKGNVTIITEDMRGRGALTLSTAIEGTDGMVTDVANTMLTVMLADCVPVVLYNPVRRVVGIAHAGWRGTVYLVTYNTVRLMERVFGSNPADVIVGIGPSIGPKVYEVGPEVAEQVKPAFPYWNQVIQPGKGDRFTFDLWESNRVQLLEAGVSPENIETAGICTLRAADRFFSERAQKPTGRFATGIMLRQ